MTLSLSLDSESLDSVSLTSEPLASAAGGSPPSPQSPHSSADHSGSGCSGDLRSLGFSSSTRGFRDRRDSGGGPSFGPVGRAEPRGRAGSVDVFCSVRGADSVRGAGPRSVRGAGSRSVFGAGSRVRSGLERPRSRPPRSELLSSRERGSSARALVSVRSRDVRPRPRSLRSLRSSRPSRSGLSPRPRPPPRCGRSRSVWLRSDRSRSDRPRSGRFRSDRFPSERSTCSVCGSLRSRSSPRSVDAPRPRPRRERELRRESSSVRSERFEVRVSDEPRDDVSDSFRDESREEVFFAVLERVFAERPSLRELRSWWSLSSFVSSKSPEDDRRRVVPRPPLRRDDVGRTVRLKSPRERITWKRLKKPSM